jgi:thymidine kinase
LRGHPPRKISPQARIKMSLELIVGPMFAGKSSAILSRVRRARTLDWNVFLVTCAIDTRYDASGCQIITHDKDGLSAIGVKSLEGVRGLKDYIEARLVVIEEAQFFTDLFEFVKLAVEEDKKDVVVVGLDGDSDRKPFGQVLDLIPLSDKVTKLTSLCKRCGDGTPAIFSALVRGHKDSQVCVGGADMYEPMCRKHFLENK